MINVKSGLTLLLIALPLFAVNGHTETHKGKNIQRIVVDADNRPCLFFTINLTSNNNIFAVPDNSSHYEDIKDIVFAAKLSGRPVEVRTTGQPTHQCTDGLEVTGIVLE